MFAVLLGGKWHFIFRFDALIQRILHFRFIHKRCLYTDFFKEGKIALLHYCYYNIIIYFSFTCSLFSGVLFIDGVCRCVRFCCCFCHCKHSKPLFVSFSSGSLWTNFLRIRKNCVGRTKCEQKKRKEYLFQWYFYFTST